MSCVVLIGFMGVGKSVVGSALAGKLSWPFLDTDEIVEEQAGIPISTLFEERGEPAFRKLESEAIAIALTEDPSVISLGGGAPTQASNWDLLRKIQAFVVWLDAPVEIIVDRIGTAGSRPLLAGLDQESRNAKIVDMLAVRRSSYEMANLRFFTDNTASPMEWAARLASDLEHLKATA
jgi:shikimate kinase